MNNFFIQRYKPIILKLMVLCLYAVLSATAVYAQTTNSNAAQSRKKEIAQSIQDHVSDAQEASPDLPENVNKAKPSSNTVKQANTAPAPEAQPFWKSFKEGWFWYKDPPKEEVLEEPKPEKPTVKVAPKPKVEPKKQKTDLELFSEFQQKVEDARKIAIINPTLENVKNYRIMEQAAFDQSMVFAKQVGIVNSTEKALNSFASGDFPSNPIGASVFVKQRDKSRQALVNSLADTHGLFFFFRSDCPYCHAFAPILKYFQEESKFKVIPVSYDGVGIKHYPNPAPDNGIFKKFNIHTVPALVIAIPGQDKYQVINFGVTPYDEIYNKIYNFAVDKVDSPETPMKEVLGSIVLNNK